MKVTFNDKMEIQHVLEEPLIILQVMVTGF